MFSDRAAGQQALDELFSQGLLPFSLSAEVIEAAGDEEYIVGFHDSRLFSVKVRCREGDDFRDALQAAVLESVNRLTGPLYSKRHLHRH